MKKLLSLFLICGVSAVGAATLPDNMYFRAMQEEMKRTQKQLRLPDSARPFYTTYLVRRTEKEIFRANLGQEDAQLKKEPVTLKAWVQMYAGDSKHNSSHFQTYRWKGDSGRHNEYSGGDILGDSYESLRTGLWQLTDNLYLNVAKTASKKEAYRRQKKLPNDMPDFSKAPKASFVDTITPYQAADATKWRKLVEELSAAGAKEKNCSAYYVNLQFGQREDYFLDSEGDFYQVQKPLNILTLKTQFVDKDGYRRQLKQSWDLPLDPEQIEPFVRQKAAAFLKQMQQVRQAVKTETYIGPVLLTPKAAGDFFDMLFVSKMKRTKPLMDEKGEEDSSASVFKDRVGTRVMSNMFNVFDRPQLREYKGFPLSNFTPVDSEGVQAQQLHLVEKGKLKTLPTVRSLIEGQRQSNGHASFNDLRAALTNVFFEPIVSYSWEELEKQLLARCRELGLEYGYIFHSFPSEFAERIYLDGRREIVYGIELWDLNVRRLRDIRSAGDKLEKNGSVVAPAILVDELEIMPNQKKPDRKPPVPMP